MEGAGATLQALHAGSSLAAKHANIVTTAIARELARVHVGDRQGGADQRVVRITSTPGSGQRRGPGIGATLVCVMRRLRPILEPRPRKALDGTK